MYLRLSMASIVLFPAAMALGQTGLLQGLSPSERSQLYHLSEGSEGFPLSWARALQSSVTGRPFLENLERFGLLSDPSNVDGLPVGVTATSPRDLAFTGTKMIGINCAACHVGEVRYRGKSLRTLGGPSLFDPMRFGAELAQSVLDTVKSPARLLEFLQRLQAPPTSAMSMEKFQTLREKATELLGSGEGVSLAAKLKGAVSKLISDSKSAVEGLLNRGLAWLSSVKDAEKNGIKKLSPSRLLEDAKEAMREIITVARLLEARAASMAPDTGSSRPTPPGPGRVDAFGAVFYRYFKDQGVPAPYAPMSNPPLWQIQLAKWFHFDGNTDSVSDRNFGNALGLGIVVDQKTMSSTVRPRELHQLESLFWKIAPPKWPADMLGAIDATKAAQGEAIFRKECATCHAQRPYELMDPAKVGTDNARAVSGSTRVKDEKGVVRDAIVIASEYLQRVRAQALKDNQISPEEQRVMAMGRPDPGTWRSTGKYRIPKLTSVWATAPYLHNGSVPTLYDLLLPAASRPSKFLVGSYEFDPAKVGFVTAPGAPGGFEFNTAVRGNGNGGHEFGTRLSESDRMALIEYLKSL